jgi:RND family efflux transporter MFP subunit
MRRRSLVFATALVPLALLLFIIVGHWRRTADVRVTVADVTSGPIVRRFTTDGTFVPARIVDTGTQVSGTVRSVEVDFNTQVRAGQVIARLDQAAFDTEIAKAAAGVLQSQADVTRLTTAAKDARTRLTRAEALAANALIAATDLEAALVAAQQAEAELKAQEAELQSRRAMLRLAQVNRDHAIIRSPIDGVVVNRAVEVGQTVAASFEAPVLFTIAELSQMQLLAEIDEADVGGVQPGTMVTFDVESLGGRRFNGRVSQVRLQPIVQPATAGTSGSTSPATGANSPATSSFRSAATTSTTATSGTGAPLATSQSSTSSTASGGTNSMPGPSGTTGATGQGIVSYIAVIDVANAERQLAPGSTAIVTVEGSRRGDVIRIPNKALTFRPAPEMLQALGQDEPALDRPETSSKAVSDRQVLVWKFENGRFVAVAVRTGLADEQWTEMVSGDLRSGDRLVTSAAIGR